MIEGKYLHLVCSASAMAIAALSLPGVAAAQEAAVEEGTDMQTGNDIVVTATRRAERLQDVALAVSAMSNEQLVSRNISQISEITSLTPSFRYQEGSSSQTTTFSIRGISTFANAPGVDSAVGVAIDNVPVARTGGALSNMFDIERVEVLRGPQGTLFGKNASAGVVSVITRRPEMDQDSVTAKLYYGSFNEARGDVAVNAALAPNLAVRITGWHVRHDGFMKNIRLPDTKVGKVRDSGLRLRLRAQPVDTVDINLIAEFVDNNTNGPLPTLREIVTNDPGGVVDAEVGLGIKPGPNNRTVAESGAPTDFRLKQKNFTGQVDIELGDHTLTSITGYRVMNDNSIFDPVTVGGTGPAPRLAKWDEFYNNQHIRYDQFSQEVRIASPGNQRLTYVVGAYYSDLDFDMRVRQYIPANFIPTPTSFFPFPLTRDVRFAVNTKTFSVFGQGTYEVADKLNLIFGARYNRDKVSGGMNRDYLVPPTVVAGPIAPGQTFGPFSAERSISQSKVTGTVGLKYEISRDKMVYATVARGYHGPGLGFTMDSTAAALAPPTNGVVKAETSTSYEIGLKSSWFDNVLMLNIAAYHEVFKNFQAQARLPGALPTFGAINANELQTSGVEVEYGLRPITGLSINGFVSYNDAHFNDFPNAPCYPAQTEALGCVGGVQDLKGVTLSLAPKWTHGATMRYEAGISENLEGFAQIGYNFVSSQSYNNTNSPVERQGSYTTVDATIGIVGEEERWQLAVYAKNLLNEKYVGRVSHRAGIGGAVFYNIPVYSAEQTFGASISFKY